MATQTDRPIGLTTPLGEDVLLLQTMIGDEHLGRLFRYELTVSSTDESIKMDDILGQNVTVRLDLAEGKKRFFNGFVSRFAQTGRGSGLATYHMTVRPWLWFLTRRQDCRIFQKLTVPEIIKRVFRESGFTDVEASLSGSYRTWEYCVQYRETDFDFVSRLMEQEGIYYYFKHQDKKHTLVLSDSYSSHSPVPGNEKVPYYPPTENVVREEDHIEDWAITRELTTGKYALQDFDFERPSVDLAVKASIERKHQKAEFEIYDYPGEYLEEKDGKKYARTRIEELGWQHELLQGGGTTRGFHAGGIFSLTDYPREDQNREYLIVAVNYSLQSNEFESGGSAAAAPTFECRFDAIESKVPYRTPRYTPKPVVQGPQTAIVVGPAGEELHTDPHGRVKVQFHWDRQGKKDENSSCWVRVSHSNAGKGWGSMITPRIGQEVIVDFLEGDADRPIITGRVYNADQPPPYAGGNGVVSGMKSNTHKGSGYNEMSMDDTAGKEAITIHAQYDMNTTVEHDATHTVVTGKFTEKIKADTSITIETGNYSHDVATGTSTHHVTGAVAENFDDTQTTSVVNGISITSEAADVYIQGATSIQLHVGSSTLSMDSDGNISLEGVNVTIKGTTSVTVKGGVVHSEADSEHQTKGAIVLSEGSATNTVKGGMVMLNP